MNVIVAKYLIQTFGSLDRVIEQMLGEQSSGTFTRLPGETDELVARHRARLRRIESSDGWPNFTGASEADGVNSCIATVEIPAENVGDELGTLMATVAGNIFETRDLHGLRLLDIELPARFAEQYPGPQFGIAGTRELCGVHGRPIIGTIIKPSVGLTPLQTAEIVRQLCVADIDFIKDDELIANPEYSPIADRIEVVMRVINDHVERTGKRVMYAFNITDRLDNMLRHHDMVLSHGGTCVMICLNSVGITAADHLRRNSQLPIHGHRNGWGYLTRGPQFGFDYRAYQKIWRIAGIDHLHVNGIDNKFWEPNDSVEASIAACLDPIFGGYQAMPVVSSGQWGGQAPETLRRTGTVDMLYLAGGGIMAHPGGPAAGLTGIRQAWEAAVQGIPLDDYARGHTELRQAIEAFGKRS